MIVCLLNFPKHLSNIIDSVKLLHWPYMGGLLLFIQWWGCWSPCFLYHTRALLPVATCHQLPYLRPVPSATKPAILIMTSFSLWRHWRHAQCYGRMDILPRLIYRGVTAHLPRLYVSIVVLLSTGLMVPLMQLIDLHYLDIRSG